MIGACARARNVPHDNFTEWIESEGLNDPNRFLPALQQALESLVPEDAWLFDRTQFSPSD